MKINRLALNIVAHFTVKGINKRTRNYPSHGLFKEWLDVPFIDDGSPFHKYDVYLAKENRKRVCIIDVHGGAYMFTNHKDNYLIAIEFLNAGYDVVCVDYLPNDGKRDTRDLVEDTAKCITHLVEHLKDYDLENDQFVMMGDSAGGHIALLLSEMLLNPSLQEKIGITLPKINILAVLLNSPVYDFTYCGYGTMTEGAMKRMFGENYSLEKMDVLSPKNYIDSLTVPLFVSTCKKDFIRQEPLKLKEDMKHKDPSMFRFIDVDSTKKGVGHVHNVTFTHLEESKYVNNQMIDFINNIIKK